ncbi:MAG: SGNH/GDSL hydrolase family protein [Verrucomicrobia bacterium]|nr:SGNH/GDSL hydrolase family protein [Verrucomicrobiota bacterium]
MATAALGTSTKCAAVNRRYTLLALLAGTCLGMLCGCATGPREQLKQQIGESFVFVGEEPASLAHLPARDQRFGLRSTYLPGADTVEYEAGRDFVLDITTGTLRRTPDSRIPDFRTNVLYGQQAFDHSKFPGFGNTGFFAFAEYRFAASTGWPRQLSQAHFLKQTRAKLTGGEPVKLVAFGDSITAGGDATRPELIFWQRWADELQRKYPRANVTVLNGATGGDSTVQGLQRLQTKVLDEKPDLVLIGFGMNDHNLGGVPIPQFELNLKQMIALIRSETQAEMVLFSAFPPNPHWKYGTHRMSEYAAATERVAREAACAYADVFNNWQAMAALKKPEDLLGNNINHPNDFGHWIYYRVFGELGL